MSPIHPRSSTSSECLTSFLYVFLVCGAAAGAGVGASVSSVLLATALASGLTIAALTQVFAQLSGRCLFLFVCVFIPIESDEINSVHALMSERE